MPNVYGTDSEPGVISEVLSEFTVGVAGDSPGDVALVGPADLEDGEAEATEVKVISRPSQARDYFGSESALTQNVVDALGEGAKPIYAAAVGKTEVDDEGVTEDEGELEEAPLVEGETVATDGDVHYAIGEPLPEPTDVEDDSFVVDPASGAYVSGISVDEVSYEVQDYDGALDEMTSGESSEVIDMLGVLTENMDVQSEAQYQLEDMAKSYRFCVGFFPAETYIEEKVDYQVAFDDSRIQMVYPTRDDEGNHIIGAYVGMRGNLGISTTPIKTRLETKGYLSERLNEDERANLIENFVVPIQSGRVGAKVMDDINTVDVEENEAEANYRFAYSRLVLDYIIKAVELNEDDYIGDLHRPAKRDALEADIRSSMQELKESAQVFDFSISVEAEDSTTAHVELGLDLAEPLRFIENTITVEG